MAKTEKTDGSAVRHIVFIGASVGNAWNVPGLPGRVGDNRYEFEYVGCYRYDKSDPIKDILGRTQGRPDAIIIKECAAYFPSDITFADAKTLMIRWIRQIHEAGIVPVPATIVPVTHARDERYRTRNPIKRLVKRVLGISMMTQMDRIAEFNTWLRDYCEKEGLVFLDLEKAMRISDNDRYLKDAMTKGDGLHLNTEAYRILDQTMIPTLDKAFDAYGAAK